MSDLLNALPDTKENHAASHSAHGWALLKPHRTSLTHKCYLLPMLTSVTWKVVGPNGSKPVGARFWLSFLMIDGTCTFLTLEVYLKVEHCFLFIVIISALIFRI